MPGRADRIAELERRLAARRAGHDLGGPMVITIGQLRAMSPPELVDAYRECLRGRTTLETGRDRQRCEIPDPNSLTPAERAQLYRELVHHGQ